MIVRPADCLSNVAGHFFHGHVGNEAVIGRDEEKALVRERLRLLFDAFFAALFITLIWRFGVCALFAARVGVS